MMVRVSGGRAGRAAACAGALAALVLLVAACRPPAPRPITIEDRSITIENQTAETWRNVEVWVNDNYRVTKPELAPRERFAIPMTAFVAGFGQRYDPLRQILKGIEVTATTASGAPVRLSWGTGRRR